MSRKDRRERAEVKRAAYKKQIQEIMDGSRSVLQNQGVDAWRAQIASRALALASQIPQERNLVMQALGKACPGACRYM